MISFSVDSIVVHSSISTECRSASVNLPFTSVADWTIQCFSRSSCSTADAADARLAKNPPTPLAPVPAVEPGLPPVMATSAQPTSSRRIVCVTWSAMKCTHFSRQPDKPSIGSISSATQLVPEDFDLLDNLQYLAGRGRVLASGCDRPQVVLLEHGHDPRERLDREHVQIVDDAAAEPLMKVDDVRVVCALHHRVRLAQEQLQYQVQLEHGRAHVEALHLSAPLQLIHPERNLLETVADRLHDRAEVGRDAGLVLDADLSTYVCARSRSAWSSDTSLISERNFSSFVWLPSMAADSVDSNQVLAPSCTASTVASFMLVRSGEQVQHGADRLHDVLVAGQPSAHLHQDRQAGGQQTARPVPEALVLLVRRQHGVVAGAQLLQHTLEQPDREGVGRVHLRVDEPGDECLLVGGQVRALGVLLQDRLALVRQLAGPPVAGDAGAAQLVVEEQPQHPLVLALGDVLLQLGDCFSNGRFFLTSNGMLARPIFLHCEATGLKKDIKYFRAIRNERCSLLGLPELSYTSISSVSVVHDHERVRQLLGGAFDGWFVVELRLHDLHPQVDVLRQHSVNALLQLGMPCLVDTEHLLDVRVQALLGDLLLPVDDVALLDFVQYLLVQQIQLLQLIGRGWTERSHPSVLPWRSGTMPMLGWPMFQLYPPHHPAAGGGGEPSRPAIPILHRAAGRVCLLAAGMRPSAA
uniref:Uncharacterized protein n=1 Tax=Anopheles atroparvus TaxID=41427 RepID=A0A182JFT9_ANOAO